MDIFEFIKTVDLPMIAIDENSCIICKNRRFNEVFGRNISDSKFQKFKNSFSIQSCMLYPENISNYNPINLAIEANGNFETIASFQQTSEDYMTFLILSSKVEDKFIIQFIDLTKDNKLEELEFLYKNAQDELSSLQRENTQYLETKEKAQNQAIKMALLNRLFEALRKSIDLDTTLNYAFKELSNIFGFSKIMFTLFNENQETFEIKNIYPKKYENEILKKIEIDKATTSQLRANKFVISNIASNATNKEIITKPECRIMMPIYHTKKLLGAICAIFPRQNLSKISEDMINAISAQFTSAIVQASLFQELNKKNEQLENAYTQLKQAQLQLINSEKMASLGQLVAGVAHEINTPLASINSNNSIIEKMLNLDEFDKDIIDTLKSMVETDKEAIKRISNIVKSLKRFVRLDEAELQKADINKELDLTLELLKHETKNRIEIIKNYGELGDIECYPNLLNQVFMNILINAIQSIKGQGKIYITTFKEKNKLTVSIRDTGSGMIEEVKTKIFKSGFTTKKVGIGTGLGLMISKDIIEKHFGEITFNSESGEGTEFIITIPIINKKG